MTGAFASASFPKSTGDDMPFIRSLAVALLALGALGGTAQAQPKQEKLDFILNWVPGGDHVPYYYSKKMGWYRDAGIDLTIEPGKGSALALQKVGAGANHIGLADMANALVGRS
jgi:NitT/TauT family transport system substrate-binding protein